MAGVLTLLLLILAARPASAQNGEDQAVDLRPMWEAGRSARYRIEQTKATEASVQGRAEARETSTTITVEVAWEVLEAQADGGGVARMTIEELTMDLTGPGGERTTVTASRGGEGADSLRQYIKAMSGTPLKVTVESNGAIGGVDGYQAIQKKAGPAGTNLNEKYFQQIARDMAALEGGQPGVKPGQSWESRHEGSHPIGALIYDTTYTLRSVKEMAGIPVALVQRTAELDLEPDFSSLPDNAPDIDVRVTEAGQTGLILFDLSRHEVVGGHSRQILELETTVSAGGREQSRTVRETTNTQLLRIEEE